jgi:UDPglucose 6-dehydrogenase
MGKICIVGLWHLGTVNAGCFAEMGFSVVGVDDDRERVEKLNKGEAPLFEPGLDDLLHAGLKAQRLSFTTDWAKAVGDASHVVVAFDTPVDDNDDVDLSIIFKAAERMGKYLHPGSTVVIHSQVPVGTCDKIRGTIQQALPQRPFGLACVPENLKLGRAIERFRRPAMIVIGADDEPTRQRVESLYVSLPVPKVVMNIRSAEMTKHAINSYLATCVSYINELANLCDLAGADAMKVSSALRMDERVSPHAPLGPGGLGFAGATLARDIRALQGLGRRVGYPTDLFDAVIKVNETQKTIVIRRLTGLYGSLEGLTVGILGLTYKAGTSTLRRSTAIEIARELKAAGATVKAFDPKAAMEELEDKQLLTVCASPEEVATGGDALVIVTEWPEFKHVDFGSLVGLMRNPVLIDTKNMLDPQIAQSLGFVYLDIGRGRNVTASDKLKVKGVVCG